MTDIEIPLGKRRPAYRLFEMLPALLSFSMIAAPFVLSFFSPLLASGFILLYIISFFVKSTAIMVRTAGGYRLLQRAMRIDWAARLSDCEDPQHASQRASLPALHRQNLERLAARSPRLKPSEMYNAVIIATYNESSDVLRPTVEAVMASDYDMKRVILLLAYEGRDGAQSEGACLDLVKKYQANFKHMQAIKHPAHDDEVRGKGGNITFAGRALQQIVAQEGIDPAHVIVTTLDSDNRPEKGYLSYLTYEYILHPDPYHAAFQPMTLFLNNIWDVPAPMRIVATGNSFWNLVVSQRPHLLRNFASHSQGLAPLIAMNFWSTRTIVEDGHQFWRSYFRFDGNYTVSPIFLPIYQDAVLSDTYRKTLIAQFVQIRRWAYGASDAAYVATRIFRRDRTVPLADSLIKFFFLLEGHVSWASAALVITFGAFGPLLINPEAARSVAAHQLPEIVSLVQRIAMLGLFVGIFISFKILPPRPERYKRRRSLWLVVQWGLMPVTSILYGSLAAINSQTRLLLGRYLEHFDVTDKAVVGRDGKATL